jgi:predicted transcriptional regulator with HTH domain
MYTEEDFLKNYFEEKDIKGLTQVEFQVAMIGLIEKGLMEEVEMNGKKLYRPTALARKMKSHLNSNPKTQN